MRTLDDFDRRVLAPSMAGLARQIADEAALFPVGKPAPLWRRSAWRLADALRSLADRLDRI